MSERVCCARGHEWEPPRGAGPDSPCPVCGSSALAPETPRATTAGVTPGGDTVRSLPALPGYELLEELGRGGMAVVHKARQLSLNRLVAVKRVRAGAEATPEELVRFLAEGEAVAALRHPNVVQVYECGRQGGLPYFAMELVEGGSLAGRLRRGPLSPHESARLVETLARALQHAHERGIVHRDLKPSNVLLQPLTAKTPRTPRPEEREKLNQAAASDVGRADADAGSSPSSFSSSVGALGGLAVSSFTPKVADFGLARRLGGGPGLTATGAVLGTPSYMAPEQAAGAKGVGPAADVYALGAILYECLTGRPPFEGNDSLDVVVQVLTKEPVPPSRRAPGIPRDLETVCLKCLEKRPRDRYASAGELAEELRSFLEGRPIKARPPGLPGRLVKWARRRPGVAALLLVSALVGVLGAGAAGLVWRRGRADAERSRVEADRQARLEGVDELVGLAEKYRPFAGARSRVVEDLLARGERTVEELRGSGDESAPVLGRVARLQLVSCKLERRLNHSGKALARAREARALYERLAEAEPEEDEWRAGLAASHLQLAAVLSDRGKITQALGHYRRARELAGGGAGGEKARALVALCRSEEGHILLSRGDAEGAGRAFREALSIYEGLARARPEDAERQRDHADCLRQMGDYTAQVTGDPRRALESLREALRTLERVRERHAEDEDGERDRVRALGSLADALKAAGQAAEAREHYRLALKAAEDSARAYPRDRWWQDQVLTLRFREAHLFGGWEHIDAGLARAVEASQAVETHLARLQAEDPENVRWQDLRCVNLLVLGVCQAARAGLEVVPADDFAGARATLERALALAKPLAEKDRSNLSRRGYPAYCHDDLAVLYRAAGRDEEADRHRRAAGEIRRGLKAATPPRKAAPRRAGPPPIVSVWSAAIDLVGLLGEKQVYLPRRAVVAAEKYYGLDPKPEVATRVARNTWTAVEFLRKSRRPSAPVLAGRVAKRGRDFLTRLRERGPLDDEQQKLLRAFEGEVRKGTPAR